ncbi:MAG: 4Fe-4S dicluster domain-containing protein [Nitrososphaeria archaeon]
MSKISIQFSGFIKYIPARCSGCSVCTLACSLYHESAINPALSRITLSKDPFEGNHKIEICVQCYSPSCYIVCPVKAVKIDEKTGARYIDEKICIGCGLCSNVCPLMPSQQVIKFKDFNKKKIYFKCDLCKDRFEGPICVELCPTKALEYVRGVDRF